MKNSRSNIVVALVFGFIVGSVGTNIIGNFQLNNKLKKDNSDKDSLVETEAINTLDGNYADGIYEGVSIGYSKNLKVQVEIANRAMKDIQVVSHNETPGFCERAIETIPVEIIKKQSTSIDTVSGATYTSKGIINAVNNALNNAKD